MRKAARWILVSIGAAAVAAGAYAVHDLRSGGVMMLQACVETYPGPAAWVCEQSLFSQHPTSSELAEMNQRAGALFAVHQVKKESDARRFLAHYIKAGLNINAVDQRNAQRWTALHLVALDGDPVGVRVLLDHGADPSLKDADGKTAAELARERHAKHPSPGSAEAVKLLEAQRP